MCRTGAGKQEAFEPNVNQLSTQIDAFADDLWLAGASQDGAHGSDVA